jgi:hypothetical protein
VTGSKDRSKWSNGRQSLSSKRNIAKELGAKAFILIDQAMFKRYSSYYKAVEERGGESTLALDVDSKSYYGFLGGKKLGDQLIQSSNGTFKKDIKITFNNSSEPITSKNVVAILPGTEKPDEYIILSAHLDHIGMHDGEVFNGADDDGSGTVAILEIAEAFKAAAENGEGPKRSIVFLHVTAEEKGLLGSQYYTDYNPVVSLGKHSS